MREYVPGFCVDPDEASVDDFCLCPSLPPTCIASRRYQRDSNQNPGKLLATRRVIVRQQRGGKISSASRVCIADKSGGNTTAMAGLRWEELARASRQLLEALLEYAANCLELSKGSARRCGVCPLSSVRIASCCCLHAAARSKIGSMSPALSKHAREARLRCKHELPAPRGINTISARVCCVLPDPWLIFCYWAGSNKQIHLCQVVYGRQLRRPYQAKVKISHSNV